MNTVKIKSIKTKQPAYKSDLEMLKIHDHVCLIHKSSQEQSNISSDFIKTGILHNDSCIFFTDRKNKVKVLNNLYSSDVDISAAIKNNDLEIISDRKPFIKNGYFSPSLFIGYIENKVSKINIKDSKTLRIICDMDWALELEKGINKIIDYELELNALCENNNVIALCQYNYNKFNPETLINLIYTHPYLLHKCKLIKNNFFIPIAEFMQEMNTENEVKHLVNNILNIEHKRTELKQEKASLSTINESLRTIAGNYEKEILSTPDQIDKLYFDSIYKSASKESLAGGDFYDIFKIDDNNIAFFIGDICGKGSEVATLTPQLKHCLKAYVFDSLDPANAMKKTNKIFYEAGDPSLFATVFMAIYNQKSGMLTYCSAGHPNSIIKKAFSSTKFLKTTSPVIGVFDHEDKYINEQDKIDKNDTLILYTDGLTEAKNPKNKLYGSTRLKNKVNDIKFKDRFKTSELIMEDINNFSKEQLRDDVIIFSLIPR